MAELDQAEVVADHHMRVDVVSSRPKKVLIVVANPSTSTTMGWPVGFWGAELTHPYYELTERGVEVTIASPDGGNVEMDSLSDPRDPSKWSAEDLVTMGFVNTPELMTLLQNTPKLADLDLDGYDAIMVAGGQSPMFTFRENEDLKSAIAHFYESEKPTAIYLPRHRGARRPQAVRRLPPGRGQDAHRLCERRGGLQRHVRRPEGDAVACRGRAQAARRKLRARRPVQGVRHS
jgi:hypothetical protein